jgi:predicted permease
MAIRAAVGAGAGRLTRQWLVESGLTSLAGGAIGLLLAVVLLQALPSVLPADFPRVDEIAVDWRVLAFALALSASVCLVCGVIPALHGWRLNLVQSLAEDGTAPTGGSLRTPVARARAVVMAGQIALASVLLVGAGLLARSFMALIDADRGLDPRNLLTAQLPFPPSYPDARSTQVLETLSARLGDAPGVRRVSFGAVGPFFGRTIDSPTGPVEIEAKLRFVSPDYLSTIDARPIAGRLLSDADVAGSEPAIVVNRSFATRYLGPNPVGERVPLNVYDYPEWQVVGVIEDLDNGGMGISGPVDADEASAQPEIFFSYRQNPGFTPREAWIMIRTDGDPMPFVSPLREWLREQDATLAFSSVMTLEERIMTSLARPRVYALLLGGFALFALLIAGVGLFGVLSYTTALRTPEFGVRTALGATPRDVGMLVVRQALAIAVGGVLAGLAAAAVLVRSLASLVHGVAPHDMMTFAAVPLVLAAVAAAACAIPARRAARLDPRQALRAR